MTARRLTVGLLAAITLLTGCGSASAAAPAPPGPSAALETIENCGRSLRVGLPPERVLAIKSTAIEMMLALGLQDRLVGTAFSDGPPADEWAARADGVPVVAERVPSQEAALALRPDLIYGGWESNFSAEGVGDRERLGALGVDSYVSPAACLSQDAPTAHLGFEEIFAEITEIGTLFDAEEAAHALVSAQREALDTVHADERGLTALWYSSGSDAPYIGAGRGAPQLVMATAGLTNVFADLPETWTNVSWERVGEADPDVIVLVDSAWGSAEKKIGVLEANPVARTLRAVREGRYLVVPFPASEAGVRTVGAVADLTAQLAERPTW